MDPGMDKDEQYQTILSAIAQYRNDDFVRDLLGAIVSDPSDANLAYALNKNQMASKIWLMEELRRVTNGNLGTVYVLGGWYGTLSAMLLHDTRFRVDRVFNFDIDPACEAKAHVVNYSHWVAGRFFAITADVTTLRYETTALATRHPDRTEHLIEARPNVIINTSCEHLQRFTEWYDRIPSSPLLVLQSNDYFDCDEHVNCVADLPAFQRQAPMSQLMYSGSLERKRYTRFMMIGRK